jgi:hypothetical protein
MTSSDDRQRTLDHLLGEQRGRELGLVGELAVAAGQWLAWLWTTPGMPDARTAQKAAAATVEDVTPPVATTTYSRVTVPEPEPHDDHEPTEWINIHVEVARPTDTDPGAIEEAQFRVVGGSVVLRDLDHYSLGSRRIEPGDDPYRVARSMLRGRAPKRTKLEFPNMGIA